MTRFKGWNQFNNGKPLGPQIERKEPGRNKFGNHRQEVMTASGPVWFDSKKELKRFIELQWREKAGEIRDLRRQVTYALTVNGTKVCDYIADFVYYENGLEVVEDAKGFCTKDYQLKKKLMWACHAIKIFET